MKNQVIVIQTTINKNVTHVWEYYTSAEHIVKWNFASDDWHCPKATSDLKINGKLISRMEAKDGSFGFDFEATYNTIEPFRRITYTIADGRAVVIDFVNENDLATTVTISFEAENMNSLDLQKNGWQAILDNFKAYAESK